MSATGTQFTEDMMLCRSRCPCSVFVSQKICSISTINADVRRFRWRPRRIRTSSTWCRADRMRRDGQTAAPPTDRCTVCFASPIATLLAVWPTDAATDRLGNHFVVVQHKVCRKTKPRAPFSRRNTTQQNCCYMFHTKTFAILCYYQFTYCLGTKQKIQWWYNQLLYITSFSTGINSIFLKLTTDTTQAKYKWRSLHVSYRHESANTVRISGSTSASEVFFTRCTI